MVRTRSLVELGTHCDQEIENCSGGLERCCYWGWMRRIECEGRAVE